MGMDSLHGLAIIGAGPGGIAAAIQLKRSGFEPFVYEKTSIGGLIRQANCVENYPGHFPFTSGIQIADQLAAHLSDLNIHVIPEKVISVKFSDSRFIIKSASGTQYPEIVILATGTRPKILSNIAMGSGVGVRVIYDVNDIPPLTGKDIVIVGGGDAAFDYALNLSRKHTIRILVRSNHITCLPLLAQRAESCKNITIHYETQIRKASLRKDDVELRCIQGEEEVILACSFVLAAIGREPELSCLDTSVIDLLPKLKNTGQLRMVGDVCNGKFRQLAITVGDAIRTAMDIADRGNRKE